VTIEYEPRTAEMDEREERLFEMGLTPIWRARAIASVLEAPPGTSDAPGPKAPSETTVGAATGPQARATIAAAPRATPETTVVAAPREHEIARLDWEPLISSIAGCTACALCRTRRNTVPGVGSTTAGWMFVGEAPGAEEDAQGEPFVGQAGRLLDNMLKAIGLDRAKDVYIANVLKCRPPGNRNPEPGEVAKCSPYLERQLALIKPGLIVALGRFAAMTLLDTDATIASLRGRVHQYRGVPLIVTYHPAYLLRNLPDKAKAWEDLLFARSTFARLQSGATSQT